MANSLVIEELAEAMPHLGPNLKAFILQQLLLDLARLENRDPVEMLQGMRAGHAAVQEAEAIIAASVQVEPPACVLCGDPASEQLDGLDLCGPCFLRYLNETSAGGDDGR